MTRPKNRADRRRVRAKFIKRRWRDWMSKNYSKGEVSKGFYLGRGCYCERCVDDRTRWMGKERIALNDHLKDARENGYEVPEQLSKRYFRHRRYGKD